MPAPIDYGLVLENLGAGVLIFNDHDKLVYDNAAARNVLGSHLILVRSEGWSVVAMLIDANPGEYMNANEIRAKAKAQNKPMRFSMLLSGSYTPCWMAIFQNESGQDFTQIIINSPDWSALTELMSTFRSEARAAINDTIGHAEFVRKLLKSPPPNISAEQLGSKSMGMIDLVSTKMYRLQLLIDLLHRLEVVRTGQLGAVIEQQSRKINLEDFMEDFLEEMYEDPLIDPNEETDTYRQRIQIDQDDGLTIQAPRAYLRHILRDVLRNAFLYSEPETNVTVRISSTSGGRLVQFDIKDQGCGVRAKETKRIFEPFQRGRQPQVMREHGYGLSLYLAKAEVEAMGGLMWFDSEEGAGATFSFKLPAHQPQS